VLLGGGTFGNGKGRAAEKVIKVPSKRVTSVLSAVLDDYQANRNGEELFNSYYDRTGKDHFYQLLKPLADLNNLEESDFVDWGQEEFFQPAIGVGECAGVVIDLVATLLHEAEEKLNWARKAYTNQAYADAIYHAYSVYISAAKALLLDKGVNAGSQAGIIKEFDEHYIVPGEISMQDTFSNTVLNINKNEPTPAFATSYLQEAGKFLERVKAKKEAA
jgi:sulfite reductase (ferredoxin)